MKILFLTDNFPPEVNAPATRTYEHCKEWVKQGEEVTVIMEYGIAGYHLVICSQFTRLIDCRSKL